MEMAVWMLASKKGYQNTVVSNLFDCFSLTEAKRQRSHPALLHYALEAQIKKQLVVMQP